MSKAIPFDNLVALFDGRGMKDVTYLLRIGEDKAAVANEVAYLQGRFDTLSAENRTKAMWRKAALLYADWKYVNNRHVGQVASDDAAALDIGCSSSSLRRWRKIINGKKVGSGFWHLYLTSDGGGTKLPPEVWLLVQEKLLAGVRPSTIAKDVRDSLQFDISERTIQRIGKSEASAGRLERTTFKNRFM